MKKLFSILSLLIFALCAVAQAQVTFTSRAPLNALEGERFRVEFILKNAAGSAFVNPKFEGLKVLAGPTMSTGQQMSIVNGVSSSSTSETYTFLVTPTEGTTKANISAAQITAEGKTLKSKPLVISIVGSASGQGTGGGSGAQQAQQIQYTKEGVADDDILLRMELSKRNSYKGEAITAQLKLYTRVGISGVENPKYASFSGFWAVEVDLPRNMQPSRSTIGGKVYEGHILRQWLLYPQRSGTITIDASSLQVMAQVITQANAISLFDQFFGGGSSVNHVAKNLSTGAISVTVEPLPSAGAPVGLPVAVGDFSLSSSLSDSVISANSAGSLILKIEGEGDFPLMESPTLKLPAEFEQYETKVIDKLGSSLSGTRGSKEWEFPFIARSQGQYTIPKVEFAFFNPKTKKYTVLSTPEYNLTIGKDSGGGATTGSGVAMGVRKEEVEMLGQDIRYIKRGELSRVDNSTGVLLYSATFFTVIALLGAVAVVVLMLLKKQSQRRADVVGTKTRKASKVALRRLKSAKGMMESGRRSEFFVEMLSAMWGFVGDRYHIPVAEQTKERVVQEFLQRGVDVSVGEEFVELVSQCEMAQYAPSISVDMSLLYSRALRLFDSI